MLFLLIILTDLSNLLIIQHRKIEKVLRIYLHF
jgi:hypothetical protein